MKKIYECIDGVWQWIAEKVFVRFEFELPTPFIKTQLASGKVVFAMTSGGMLDWFILSSWCRSQGLGAILVANRKRILFLSKPICFLQVLFGQRSFSDLLLSDEPGPRLIFCPTGERKRPFDPTPVERILANVYTEAVHSKGSWTLLPVLFLWKKLARRGEPRSLSEFLFGLGSSPNLVGKILYLILKRKDSTVRALAPLELTKDISPEGGDEPWVESDALRVAKAVRRRILVLVNQEFRLLLGPTYSSPQSVKETLLKNAEIQDLVGKLAAEEHQDRRKVMTRSYLYLNEMVSNYQYRFIEVMYVFLTWLFNKVFEGLEVRSEELHELREIMKTKPVVLVPCHRSHLDYLVIPYVLFCQDMVPPHVAAGVNLSFWPLGPLLRMGGAFYIRRSFRGNPLYALCLRKYIEYLVVHRHTVAFFIEGTRSRSGKMLAPQYGILKMILEAHDRKVVEDIAIVPIALCYDAVLEQRSYTKELKGAEKKAESTSGLLKSRQLIKRNIGKVYLRLAPPLYARDIGQGSSGDSPESRLSLQKAAFEISKRINDATPITAKSIVCSVLLGYPLPSLPLEEILRVGLLFVEYARFGGSALSIEPCDENQIRRALEQVLRQLTQEGLLTASSGVPRAFACENRKRIVLNFYKNNAIHCFVLPAMVLLAFFKTLQEGSNRTATPQEFYDGFMLNLLSLRNILKFEFFFSPTQVYTKEVERAFSFFFGEGQLGEKTGDELEAVLFDRYPTGREVLSFMRLLGELLDSYGVALEGVKKQSGTVIEKKALIQSVFRTGESKNLHGQIRFAESVSTQNYTNALLLMENLGFVIQVKEPDKTFIRILDWTDGLETVLEDLKCYGRIFTEA